MGESLSTVQKFNVQLAQATTSSLDALKAYSLARKAPGEKGHVAAFAYDQRAIALDPKFAMGYQALAAVKKSLELRGDGGTGWSTVWRAALWARLQNSEHAYNNLKILINTSTLPNMFDLCPPFQIDGNLGGPAAITEMLVQSTPDEIKVLPALPRQWPSGSLKGAARARRWQSRHRMERRSAC